MCEAGEPLSKVASSDVDSQRLPVNSALDSTRLPVFDRDLLRPSLVRKAAFDTLRDSSAAAYAFECASCGTNVSVPFIAMTQIGVGYERELGRELAARAREHFGIGLVGKAHDGGWPSMVRVACTRCGAAYLVYAGVREPANGWLLVTVQGITELAPGARAVQRYPETDEHGDSGSHRG